ncbi:WhiB family transcriptional regulator [Kitasatospora sp. NPDC056181]|uniref:WhiB family transcriptional regulator n=1 Tax=Kitasatospora sp. NPDC056181 TaxID=3345737 RepID=UPI0035DADB09
MTARHTLRLAGTTAPHRAARPAATVLSEYTPDPAGDLHGAACAGLDTNMFYPDPDEMGPAAAEWAERRARMICAGCPVRLMCLELALERGEKHGVFGSLNAAERHTIRERRRKARAKAAGGAR